MKQETDIIPVSCNKDCGAGCPLLAHVKGNKIVKITDNPDGSAHMKGCAKGFMAARAVISKDRLLDPLIRTGPRGSGQFKKVSWHEALDYTAQNLEGIKQKYGNDSVLFLGGSGSCRGALHNTWSLTERFLNLFGSNVIKTGNYSSAASDFVTPYVFGTSKVGIDPATLKYSKLIILWGANIMDTRFGCEFPSRIREAAQNGTRILVIDPRRSNTIEQLNAEWIRIKPGTDTALMAAVLYELINNAMVDHAFLDKYCTGFDQVKGYVLGATDNQPKTPQWAKKICGTDAKTIKKLAALFGRSKPAALIPGLSIQRTIGGEEAMRMAMVLQAATGNIGKLGGASGGCIWDGLPSPVCGEIDPKSNPTQSSIPEYNWPDAILKGKKGGYPCDIKVIYNVGGNYLSQGSDIHKNIRAFETVEFSICHDQFMTPTASYCDVVLPVTSFLERNDILFTGMNYLFYSQKALIPPESVKNDYDIFSELAGRLGFSERYTEGKSESEWIDQFIAESEISDPDEFKSNGIYLGRDQMRVGLADYISHPEKNPLNTPSGKIDLAPEEYSNTGFPAVPEYRGLEDDPGFPLKLISPHSLYRINSSYANIDWFNDRQAQALWMNPADARKRKIKDNQVVSVKNENGETRVQVKVTNNIMNGVVCLFGGAWAEFNERGVDTAGSPNVLTSTEPTLPSYGSRTHSTLVEVTLI